MWAFYQPSNLDAEITTAVQAQRRVKEEIRAVEQETAKTLAKIQANHDGNWKVYSIISVAYMGAPVSIVLVPFHKTDFSFITVVCHFFYLCLWLGYDMVAVSWRCSQKLTGNQQSLPQVVKKGLKWKSENPWSDSRTEGEMNETEKICKKGRVFKLEWRWRRQS